jgi:hypothetical protein
MGGVRLEAYGGQCVADGGGREHIACGVWHVAGGRLRMVADIMMSVDIMV